MVKQEDLELGTLALRSPSLLQRALEDELPLLVTQSEVLQRPVSRRSVRLVSLPKDCAHTHDCFAVLEDELLVELGEVEPVLALASLDVDPRKELANELDDLRQGDLVRVVVGGVLQAGVEQQRVSSESGRRLGQVAVQLEFS